MGNRLLPSTIFSLSKIKWRGSTVNIVLKRSSIVK